MEAYDIVSFIWLIVSSIMLIYMANKTENLEDTVTNLYSYINVTLDPKIKAIRQLVTDEIINKKENNVNKCSMQKCPESRWIPVTNPREELPKDRELYVTVDDAKYASEHRGYRNSDGDFYVDTLYWDMTEWSDECIVDYVIAYMVKNDPEPYLRRTGGNDEVEE